MSKTTQATGPATRPAHPGDILADDSLSDEQKRDYLEDWRLDLVERQTATGENMPAGTAADDNTVDEQLREVSKALATLEASG